MTAYPARCMLRPRNYAEHRGGGGVARAQRYYIVDDEIGILPLCEGCVRYTRELVG